MVASIGRSLSEVGFVIEYNYPRFTGAPFRPFSMLPTSQLLRWRRAKRAFLLETGQTRPKVAVLGKVLHGRRLLTEDREVVTFNDVGPPPSPHSGTIFRTVRSCKHEPQFNCKRRFERPKPPCVPESVRSDLL